MKILILVFSFVFIPNGSNSLTCPCNSGPKCSNETKTCETGRNFFSLQRCEYIGSSKSSDAKYGCNIDPECGLVRESTSVEVAYRDGKILYSRGCCSQDLCMNDLRQKMEKIGSNSCAQVQNQTADAFSCHCDPSDMAELFDISVGQGVEWYASNNSSNATDAFERSMQLRTNMANFCTNSMCNPQTILSSGISAPSNAQPVCAYYIRADTGKVIRGCAFVATGEKRPSVNSLRSALPTAGNAIYDVRIGVNVSDKFNFVVHCRSDMCNERQLYENIALQCLGVDVPAATSPTSPPPVVLVEPAITTTPSSGGQELTFRTSGSDDASNATVESKISTPVVVIVQNGTETTQGPETTAEAGAVAENATVFVAKEATTLKNPATTPNSTACNVVSKLAFLPVIAFYVLN